MLPTFIVLNDAQVVYQGRESYKLLKDMFEKVCNDLEPIAASYRVKISEHRSNHNDKIAEQKLAIKQEIDKFNSRNFLWKIWNRDKQPRKLEDHYWPSAGHVSNLTDDEQWYEFYGSPMFEMLHDIVAFDVNPDLFYVVVENKAVIYALNWIERKQVEILIKTSN